VENGAIPSKRPQTAPVTAPKARDKKRAKQKGGRRGASPGEGHVRERTDRPGTWQARITRDGVEHKRDAPDKAAARAHLRQMRRQLEDGLPVGDDTRLGPWCDWWLENVAAAKSPATAYNSRWALGQLSPRLTSKRVREMRVADVEAELKRLSARKPRKGTRGAPAGPLGQSALIRIRSVLGQVLAEAERRDLVGRNVARLALVPVGAALPTERSALSVEAAGALVNAARGSRHEALVVVMLYHGLRPGEVTGLLWESVDLENAELEIVRSRKVIPTDRSAGRKQTMTLGATKSWSDRVLRMPPHVVVALRDHQRRQKAEQLAAPVWENRGLVFASAMGGFIDPAELRRVIGELCTKAKIPPVSPNTLRHTAASHRVDEGNRIEAVADMLGHRDMTMLGRTYRHRTARLVDVTGTLRRTPAQRRQGGTRQPG
jgi:integrase